MEPELTGAVVVATFQNCDKNLVLNRRMSLVCDIRAQLAPGEAAKVFKLEAGGIWFNDVHRNSRRKIRFAKPSSIVDQDHILHTHTILSSPPKKRALNPGPGPTQTRNSQAMQPNHPQHTTSPNPAPAPAPAPATAPVDPIITQKVQQMEQNLLLQFQWNREMDNRMGALDSRITSLALTKNNTDAKIDIILVS